MYGYTYLITNLINGHQYVGQHQYDKPELDPNYFGSGELLKLKIKEYGKENFSIELIEVCNSQEELDDAETRGIYEYKTFVDWGYGGYNLTTGGGGYKRSEVTKEKQSKIQKERFKDPKEIEKISIGVKEALKRPEVKEKMIINGKKTFENHPEKREYMSDVTSKRYEDPKEREKTGKERKKYFNNKENKLKHSKATKAGMQRPEVKAKLGSGGRGKPSHNANKIEVRSLGHKRYMTIEEAIAFVKENPDWYISKNAIKRFNIVC